MSLVVTLLFDLLRLVTFLAVVVTAAKGVIQTVAGVKAKRAAQRLIAEKHDAMLTKFTELAVRRKLNDSEIDRARMRVAEYLTELPRGQAILVEKGISQASRVGEKRYVEEIIGVQGA